MSLRKRKKNGFYDQPVMLGLEHGIVYSNSIADLIPTDVPFLSMREIQLLQEYEADFIIEDAND